MPIKLMGDKEFLIYCIQRDTDYMLKIEEQYENDRRLLLSNKQFIDKEKAKIREMKNELKEKYNEEISV
jgi:hypothetical protein